MKSEVIATSLLKLCILAAAGWGLYYLWHGGGASGGGSAEEAIQTQVAVQVGKVKVVTLRRYVSAYGTVEPQPAADGKASADAFVMAPSASLIAESRCTLGQHVEKGAVLFTLDGRIVDAAVARARATSEVAEQNYQRQEEVVKAGAATKQLIEARQQLTLAKADLANALAQRALLQIVSPINGTVVSLNVKPGDVADPTKPLAELMDLDHMVIAALVPSSQLDSIKPGQTAELHMQNEAINGASSPIGSVTFINAEIDPKANMGTVLISAPASVNLRPGQFVRAQIVVEEQRNQLAVPAEAIVTTGGKSVISVVNGDIATQKPIQTGLRDGTLVGIQGDGIQADQPIVTVGAYGLPKETPIRLLDQ